VSLRSGDSLIRNGEAEAPDVIKIDVEGHEIAVLDGLRDHISKARNLAVVCEFNPPAMKKAGYEPLELLRKLLSADFGLWNIDGSRRARAIRTLADAKQFTGSVESANGYVNIFAVKGHEAALTVGSCWQQMEQI
jgi:Methyltransferase FkbM domain